MVNVSPVEGTDRARVAVLCFSVVLGGALWKIRLRARGSLPVAGLPGEGALVCAEVPGRLQSGRWSSGVHQLVGERRRETRSAGLYRTL